MVSSSHGLRSAGTRPRVLIIVQNLPVPFDRRVWLECQSLTGAGYDVTVICPRGENSRPFQIIDDVTIYTYSPYAPGGTALGFVLEYAHSFMAIARLVAKARRHGRFGVLQACNPPDIFWPLARLLRALDGTRFVFDHHDLCPELYESRFPKGAALGHRALLLLEWATFRAADRVTSTNQSYADVAIERGGKSPESVTVVRTGPDPDRLRPISAVTSRRRGRDHLVAYIGVMGPQDGVDLALAAAEVVVKEMGRQDIAFTLMGNGDCFDSLIAERDRLGLAGYVEFTGRVPDETVTEVFSTAEVGLSPDPKNALNDVSTMNKTMEYMAFALPVVAFDLHETRVSAGDAALYARPNDVHEFASAIVELIDQPGLRAEMGRRGRERVETELAWSHQQKGYLAVFDELIAAGRRSVGVGSPPADREA